MSDQMTREQQIELAIMRFAEAILAVEHKRGFGYLSRIQELRDAKDDLTALALLAQRSAPAMADSSDAPLCAQLRPTKDAM